MAHSTPGRGLYGRRAECEALDRMLADAGAGQSQSLVLRGEAGVGKSALVEHLTSGAAGFQIQRAVGIESEMELAYAGVHQLCLPLLGKLDRLPEPQRAALSVAFGLSSGSAPDRFLVGLAVLSLLAEAAEEQPLLCVVDDAQWLDQVSVQTLAFVARRLLAEPVALLFAVRTGPESAHDDPLSGVAALTVTGLRDDDARELLTAVLPGRVDQRILNRIIAETGGNPLALLELTHGLTAAELAGGFGLPDARPLPSQIEQNYLRRIEALPADAQRLLLVAAAEPIGDVPLLRRAAERLAIGAEAADAVAAAGLVEFGTRVRFRHPLVRSAAYRAADPRDRRDAHRALAEATDSAADADRRTWHRAHAAAEPDEDLAGELERSADRARARGGIAAAAAFLKRATELTPGSVRRGTRAIAAARAAFEAGSPSCAQFLAGAAELSPLDKKQEADLARLRARIAFTRRRGTETLPLLLDAAERLARIGDPAAREAYLDAIGAAVFAGRLGREITMRQVAEAARSAPPGPEPPEPTDLLLDGLAAWFTRGYAEGAPGAKEALAAFRQAAVRGSADNADITNKTDDDIVLRWLWLTWLVAGELWDDESWHVLISYAVRTARESGALGALPFALTYRASAAVHEGEFDRAAALIAESGALAEVGGHAPVGYSSLLLIAWRGDDERAAERISSGAGAARGWTEGRAFGGEYYLLATLYNGLGRYQDALDNAARAVEYEDLAIYGFALFELIEAAARANAPEAAEEALRRLEERTLAAGSEWALGVLARSKALLADGPEADGLFREAIGHLERSRIAVHLARTHLVYGEWLRREGRRIDARTHLGTAHEMFQRFGAAAFAERTRRELAGTGLTVRQRAVEVPDADRALTAQEAQIARLAADGMTNSEIGGELFISPRTVEWHLRKVFTKLDVNSRNKLRAVLTRG